MPLNHEKRLIKKSQLVEIITQWGQGELSNELFQLWMLDNFEPADIVIEESEWTVQAMQIVMNEYELVDINKCVITQYPLALAFIETSEDDFDKRKRQFLRQAFID